MSDAIGQVATDCLFMVIFVLVGFYGGYRAGQRSAYLRVLQMCEIARAARRSVSEGARPQSTGGTTE